MLKVIMDELSENVESIVKFKKADTGDLIFV